MNSKQVYDHWDNTELAYEATDHTEDEANWLNESKLESDREECDVCSKPFKSKTRLKTHMKKFHGIESILTKIEKEENIEENFGELEDSEFQPRKAGKKSGRQKCPINPCSKSFKGRFSERMGCKSSAIFFFKSCKYLPFYIFLGNFVRLYMFYHYSAFVFKLQTFKFQ